jgi:hypothetical protein
VSRGISDRDFSLRWHLIAFASVAGALLTAYALATKIIFG